MIFLKGKLGSEYLVLLLGFFIANWAFAGAGEQMLPERCNAVLLADTFPRLTSYDVQARNLGEKEKSATLSADGFQLFFNESLSLQQQAKIFKAFKSLLANEDKNFNHKHMNIYRTMAGEWVRQKYYRDLRGVTRSKVLEIKDEDALFYFNLRYKWLSELVTSRYPGMSLEQHCEMGTVAAVFEIRVDGTHERNKTFHMDKEKQGQEIIMVESLNLLKNSLGGTWGINKDGEIFSASAGVPMLFLSQDGDFGPGFYHASPPTEFKRGFVRAILSYPKRQR